MHLDLKVRSCHFPKKIKNEFHEFPAFDRNSFHSVEFEYFTKTRNNLPVLVCLRTRVILANVSKVSFMLKNVKRSYRKYIVLNSWAFRAGIQTYF